MAEPKRKKKSVKDLQPNCVDVMLSVHSYDSDGDLNDPGIFLHFGETRIKVATSPAGLRKFAEIIQSAAEEVEENYSQCFPDPS